MENNFGNYNFWAPYKDYSNQNIPIIIHPQAWSNYGKFIIASPHGSVGLYIYKDPVSAYISGLYVSNEARQSGEGTALIASAEDLAKENGCVYVDLLWDFNGSSWSEDCGNQSFKILEWYRRRGYHEIQHYGDGCIILRKQLRNNYNTRMD